MSREVKRVALDFDWPYDQDKVWEGYIRPDRLSGTPCPDCEGGQTHFGWWLQHIGYLLGMLAEDVRNQENGKPLHPWLENLPYPHGHFEYLIDGTWRHNPPVGRQILRSSPSRFVIDRPGVDALTFFSLLTDIPEEKLGHSWGNNDVHYAVMRKLVEVTGIDFVCSTCEGHGSLETYEGQHAEAEAWKPTEPPEGTGWQLWETVSEGSPITPVFGSVTELAEWMVAEGHASSLGVAERFIEVGYAPSAISTSEAGLLPGIEAVGRRL